MRTRRINRARIFFAVQDMKPQQKSEKALF